MIWKLLINKRLMIIGVLIITLSGSWISGYTFGRESLNMKHLKQENTSLSEEIERLNSILTKQQSIQNEVHNATSNVNSGMLPAYTSAVLDCLRSYSNGKKCVQPSTIADR